MLGRRTWRRARPTHFRRRSGDHARIGAVVAVFFRHLAAPWADPGVACARAGPVQAVRSALIRRMLVAVHTRSHSRAAGHWPRRLNCRNPRIRLIQP